MKIFAQLQFFFVLLSKKCNLNNVSMFFVALVLELLSGSLGYFHCHSVSVLITGFREKNEVVVAFIQINFSLNVVEVGSLIHNAEGEHRYTEISC